MRIENFLKESPMFCISLTARRFDALTARLLEADDLNLLEALILSALFFEAPTPVRPSQLAETFGSTRGNVSHCISSLEAKGLVQRRIDPDDARAVQLVLRGQGKKRAVRVVGILDRMQRRFEEGIGAAKLQGMLAQMSAVEELCSRVAKAGR